MTKRTNVCVFGYTIFRDGTIIGLKGNRLADKPTLNIKWDDGTFRLISRIRFIYWAFNQSEFNFNDKDFDVAYKNIKKGWRLDNLQLVKHTERVRGRKKLTDTQVLEIKREYHEEQRTFVWLAKKYKVSDTMIAYIIKGRKLNYSDD